MIGFIVGTACLIGLVKVARRGRCGYGHGYGGCGSSAGCGEYSSGGGCGAGGGYGGGCGSGGHGWGGHRRWHGGWGHHGHGHDAPSEGGGFGGGGPWMFQKFMLRRLFERLETTPGQEKVIVQAVEEARESIKNSVGEFRASRDDVAKAFGSESFDETILGGAFAKQDEAIGAARRTLTGAIAKIHEALDARQRGILADLIAKGPRTWGRFGGPYRA